jgi:hypothetical protein
MTMCPLPIDWLDLLDGRPSAASRAHLDDCAACRTVVASLEATRDADPLGVPVPDSWQPRPELASSDSNITFGELRWLELPEGEVRLPVLVLGIVEEANGAIDVAPLSLDRDAATSVDLLLDAADTTTAALWRVAFRQQSLVSPAFIKAQLGTLTNRGRRVVDEAIEGDAPAERTGPELESDHDSRLSADDWMRPLLAAAAETVDVDESEDDSLASSPVEASPQPGKVLLQFALQWESVSEPTQQLAAATPDWSARTLWARLNASWGLHIAARLLTDYTTDRLLLEPVSVQGLDYPVTLIVRTSVGDHPFMLQVRLHEGEAVVVAAEDAGISEHDIEALELLLP